MKKKQVFTTMMTVTSNELKSQTSYERKRPKEFTLKISKLDQDERYLLGDAPRLGDIRLDYSGIEVAGFLPIGARARLTLEVTKK